MKKLKIAILFGGCSSEYKISLQSAYAVISHLDKKKYNPVLIGITPSGEWFRFLGDIEKIQKNLWHNPGDCVPAIISPDRKVHGLLELHKTGFRQTKLDAALPLLHGKNGEDGTVQGLLELAGIPLIGCKTRSSALCMDKDKAHKIVDAAGIAVPRSFVINRDTNMDDVHRQAAFIGYPLLTKPVKAGSSLGITKVTEQSQFPEAIKNAREYDDQVIVEEIITGFEVGCSIIGHRNLVVGQVDEIQLQDTFFDFKEKYHRETAKIHVPARISPEKAEEIKKAAQSIYRALDCSGFARVDMFLTPSGKILFNEVNTIPGLTVHSRYPNMLKAIGMTFEEIIDTTIDMELGA